MNRGDLFGLSDVTIILGPHANMTEWKNGNKTGDYIGSADPITSKTSIDLQMVRIAVNEFNKKSPAGKKCKLDINWVVSSYEDPLTLERIRSAISSVSPDEPIIYSGHGYIESGEAETRTFLILEAKIEPTGRRHCKSRGYTWTEILAGLPVGGGKEKVIREIHVFSCFAGGLPEQVGQFAIHKGPPQEYHNKSVMAVEFQKTFKELIQSLCCKKRGL